MVMSEIRSDDGQKLGVGDDEGGAFCTGTGCALPTRFTPKHVRLAEAECAGRQHWSPSASCNP